MRADQSVVLVCTEIPFLDRPHQLATYAFQVRGSMRQQLVLPRRQLLVGDGVVQPAGEIPPFEVVLQCFWVEVLDRGTEFVHGGGGRDGVALCCPEVEPSLPG